jgi:CheY-like chemotaxis protein
MVDPVRAAQSAPSVLVVEDDADIRECLCLILEEHGYAPCAAANGREALELLETMREPPRIVITDLMMPVMSGWELIAALERQERMARTAVLVVTAIGAVLAPPARASLLLHKPVDVDELLSAIDRLS